MVQVSVGEPLEAGVGNISALDFEAVDAAELSGIIRDRFLVRVRDGAAGCCIDGRLCRHTLGETEPEPGPSVSGGPSITGYAAAEMVEGYFGETSSQTTLGRMVEVNDTLVAGGIVLGGHVSQGAVAETHGTFLTAAGLPKTGCGANDEFKAIMERPNDHAEAVFGVTQKLLGESAFRPDYMRFVGSDELRKRIEGYNSHDVVDMVAGRANGTNIEVLEGNHAERLVVFNYVEGTTVDRDALVTETGKQVFVVDMWYLDKMARAMAEGRPDAPEMYERLRHAMTAFQVATYLTLCDGSHRPATFKQPQTQEAAPLPG